MVLLYCMMLYGVILYDVMLYDGKEKRLTSFHGAVNQQWIPMCYEDLNVA